MFTFFGTQKRESKDKSPRCCDMTHSSQRKKIKKNVLENILVEIINVRNSSKLVLDLKEKKSAKKVRNKQFKR